MIKFRAGKKLGFGITRENVTELEKGHPIVVDLTEMGIDAEMMIFFGETMGDVYKQVEPFVTKNTIVRPTDK